MSRDLSARALDPSRSVVVSACAGSGKTWLLASRVLRLLLSGVAPGAILAITFTRRAAGEIRTRVLDGLRFLATAPEQEALAFLEERGVRADAENLARARLLFERVLTARPGLSVHTFDGWFQQLAAVAPLSANLAGTVLEESATERFEELWQGFAAKLQAAADPAGDEAALSPEVRAACLRLLRLAKLSGVRALIQRGLARRSEWLAFSSAHFSPIPDPPQSGVALAAFFVPGWPEDFRGYREYLAAGTSTDQKLAATLAAVLAEEDAEESRRERFDALASILLTDAGTPRIREDKKKPRERLAAAGLEIAHFLALHERLSSRMLECLEAIREEEIAAFNYDASMLYRAFLDHLEAYKSERRLIDFVDGEWRTLQLLRDEENAAFMQARLDARYRHVLLDEFQDTNPFQWQILLAWLDAYGESAPPAVFLVGDPKQSIYRFRRADPRLFSAASAFLCARLDAVPLEQSATRRNAPKIVELVNELFSHEPGFAPFPPQSSLAENLPGRIELLPLCAGEAKEEAAEETAGWRDPLTTPEEEVHDRRRESEAALLAGRIAALVGHCRIRDADRTERPLRYGDILILARRRTQMRFYERALAAAGIPFSAASRGGLLATQEAQDIVALLEFLSTPQADLNLAQALKSPIFACSDEDLLLLARRTEVGGCWWDRLMAMADESKAGPTLSPNLSRARRLLGVWIEDAPRLPAHDLLDRIYHQGEVLERYRHAAPPSLADAALANLRALLLFALDLDAGRYPGLPRFIAALRRFSRGDSREAPDEGQIEREDASSDETEEAGTIEVAEPGGDRVRIMTIHGAKGLEAPLVWLLDANTPPQSDKSWNILVDWQPGDEAPAHFSFVGKKEHRGTSRQPIFEAEAEAAAREELNLLYVAITRARQIFIASGVKPGKNIKQETHYFRLCAALERLKAQEETLPLRWPESGFSEPALVFGDLPLPLPKEAPAIPAYKAASEPKTAPAPAFPTVQTSAPPPLLLLPLSAPPVPPTPAARFGIVLHALLEQRAESGAIDEDWRQARGISAEEIRRALPVAERLLAAPHLARFFNPEQYRRAWNEAELCDENGALRRIDRLVEREEGFWVLDYKSGNSDAFLPQYRRQLAAYCRAVEAVFPGRPVRGALLFADATLMEIE
ncbi:MAG: UvrD-helicase domain-containing protein [Betaproteobacteria bacterium]|nr:UvrD-helicase domain-containing protein [Betaproteobacteria bacterium]